MDYVLIYNDSDGNSHLADQSSPMKEGDFTPPSPAGYLISEQMAAAGALMMHHPAGYLDEWHCAPAIVLGTLLQGDVRISTSDGDHRILSRGDQFLAADEHGVGHTIQEVRGEAYDLALVVLKKHPARAVEGAS